MKRPLLFLAAILGVSFSVFSQAPANDACTGAVPISVGSTCIPVSGTLRNSTTQNTGACGNRRDVWYSFTVPSYVTPGAPVTITVTRTNTGATNLTDNNTFIELFTNCSGTQIAGNTCQNISAPRKFTNLTANTTYYLRVNTSLGTAPNASATFDVCVVTPAASRRSEVFKQTKLSAENVLNDPWEVTYGPDGNLWVTEAKGYKVYKIDPNSGARTMVLDLMWNATATGNVAIDTLRREGGNNTNTGFWGSTWPQGGFAGLAMHPKFTNPDSAFVFVTYVHRYRTSGSNNSGIFYRNKIVRWKYDGTKLTDPKIVCDSLPGSQDHNSQRMIIAPVDKNGGAYYLFYAAGDMGAGQFANRNRPIWAQDPEHYEGKILRFNIIPDENTSSDADRWIPDDNPYNDTLNKQSAVWAIGIRNNQGFAYDADLNLLYGTSHGPYSDDELNIIEPFRNYGHPMVIGFAADGNYNGTGLDGGGNPLTTSVSAGTNYPDGGTSSCPPIINELNNVTTLNARQYGEYKDPIFSAYAQPYSMIQQIWSTNNPVYNASTGGWPSEAWTGLDLYTNSIIPGWHKSLLAASLKWGRLVRLPMAANGLTTVNNVVGDTISYFGSPNRYRDLAFAPNGRDIFIVMEKSSTSSGPSANNPVAPACAGCLLKYTFLGYADNNGKSSIPTDIKVAPGTANLCEDLNTVTINSTIGNNNIWVPITDKKSNIVAEINANGNNLGDVTASLFVNTNAVRVKRGQKYLDRNITITPQTQPSTPVKIRLYITNTEYTTLKNSSGSAIEDLDDVKIFKNNDVCGSAMGFSPTAVPMNDGDMTAFAVGSSYVIQGTTSSFSTFYFGSNALSTLPVELVNFTGTLENNQRALLKWRTENERNTSYFDLERSIDGVSYSAIANVAAAGNSDIPVDYSHIDNGISQLTATTIYYRLKMVDRDGSFKYSKVVTITLPTIVGNIIVSPNPIASGNLKVQIPVIVNSTGQWKLTDNAGRVVLQGAKQLFPGTNQLYINTNGLAAGIYNLSVEAGGLKQQIKVQKL